MLRVKEWERQGFILVLGNTTRNRENKEKNKYQSILILVSLERERRERDVYKCLWVYAYMGQSPRSQ